MKKQSYLHLYCPVGAYKPLPEVGTFVPFTTNFASGGDQSDWGVALAVPVSFTNSTNGAAVDGGAASSNGGAALLHFLQAAASDTYTIVVEGADDSGFTSNVVTLATFSLDASALGSERVSIAGTISRYTRWKATRSGPAGDTVELAALYYITTDVGPDDAAAIARRDGTKKSW